MTIDQRDSRPGDDDEDGVTPDAPPANPAYATPPPEGIPDADNS